MTRAQDEYTERQALAARRQRNDTGLTLRAGRDAKVAGKPCRLCPRTDVEAHHIVHRGRIGKHSLVVHHPDNLMPLCSAHHQNHHTLGREGRVPRAYLLPAEVEFLLEHAGEGWADKWYPTTGDTP